MLGKKRKSVWFIPETSVDGTETDTDKCALSHTMPTMETAWGIGERQAPVLALHSDTHQQG